MGKRLLRRKAAEALKRHGLGYKLYRRKNYKFMSAQELRNIVFLLDLLPGDLVFSPYSYTNRRIKNLYPVQIDNRDIRFGLKLSREWSDDRGFQASDIYFPWPLSRSRSLDYLRYQLTFRRGWDKEKYTGAPLEQAIAKGVDVLDQHGILRDEWFGYAHNWYKPETKE